MYHPVLTLVLVNSENLLALHFCHKPFASPHTSYGSLVSQSFLVYHIQLFISNAQSWAGIRACSTKSQIPQTSVQVSTMPRFSCLGNLSQEEVVTIVAVPGGEESCMANEMHVPALPTPNHALKREYPPNCCKHLSSIWPDETLSGQ